MLMRRADEGERLRLILDEQRQTVPEEEPRAFTLDEVIALGFEACHCDADGIRWLWHGGVGIRSDPSSGQCTLVCGRRLMPQGPWYPTHWGERQIEGLD